MMFHQNNDNGKMLITQWLCFHKNETLMAVGVQFGNVKVITNVQTNDMENSFPYRLSSLQGFSS